MQGLGVRGQGRGLRVGTDTNAVRAKYRTCLGLRVKGLGLRVKGSGFRVQGSGLRFQGLGFRV